MNIEHIITELAREQRRTRICRIFDRGMDDKKAFKIFYPIARSLELLFNVDREKYFELYERLMKTDDYSVPEEVPHSLQLLAKVDPKKYIELYKEGLLDNTRALKKKEIALAETLSALADIDEDTFLKLYEEGIQHKHHEVRKITASSIASLAHVNPNKFAELCERGMLHRDACVREGTAATLSYVADIDTVLFIRLCEIGLHDPITDIAIPATGGPSSNTHLDALINPYQQTHELEILDASMIVTYSARKTTPHALARVVNIDPEKYVQLYKITLSYSEYIACSAAKTVGALATVDPDRYYILVETALQELSEKKAFKRAIVETLQAIVAHKKNFVKLYTIGLKDKHDSVKYATARSLGALASIDCDLFLQLYSEGMSGHDDSILRGTIESLHELASANPDKFIELYKKGIIQYEKAYKKEAVCTERISVSIAQTLEALASVDQKMFVELQEERLRDADADKRTIWSNLDINPNLKKIRVATASTLEALAPFDPENFIRLYHRWMEHPSLDVRAAVAGTIGPLAHVDLESYLTLYEEGLASSDPLVRKKTAETFPKAAAGIDLTIPPTLPPDQLEFVTQYLQSKYVKDETGNFRNEKDIIAELKRVIQNPESDYQRLKHIVEVGEAKDFQEAIECASLPQIGNYQPIAILGRGGFKTTYLALDEVLEERVALKIMHSSDGPSVRKGLYRLAAARGYTGEARKQEALVRAFKDEAQALSKTRHPNLAKFLGAGLHPVMYLAEEYIEGQTLEDIALSISEKKQLDSSLLKYLYQVTLGLAHLHSQRIVHLDVKPANVMVHPKRGGVLTDFGSCHILSESGEVQLEKPTSRIYQAPEMIRRNTISYATDMWMFGVSAFMILTGYHPYCPELTLKLWHDLDPKDPLKDKLADKVRENIIDNKHSFDPLSKAGIQFSRVTDNYATIVYSSNPLNHDSGDREDLYPDPDCLLQAIDSCLIINPEKRIKDAYSFVGKITNFMWYH